jgi:hypothetical protein
LRQPDDDEKSDVFIQISEQSRFHKRGLGHPPCPRGHPELRAAMPLSTLSREVINDRRAVEPG